jgi:phosphoserine aminotransferase
MTKRIFNFNAGPGVLPEPVLEEAQKDLMSLPGVGMSVLEISHRSKTFDEILHGCEDDMRRLAGIPGSHKILFLQGGATLQFAMVPMNLAPAGARADYVVTGTWGQKAAKEAQKIGASVRVLAPTEPQNFDRIPDPAEIAIEPGAAFVHFTSNETIHGVEWTREPDPRGAPLVCDASSDIFSRPIDVARYGLLYAGAQKNLGPSGVTLVVVREDLLSRSPKGLPTMLDYNAHVKENSLYNTPSVFGVYMIRLTMKWLLAEGGLEGMGRRNAEKAKLLYDTLDGSGGFYRPHAKPGSRSQMNVTFRLPSEELEKRLVSEAKAAGLEGLAGHRSVGGIRASIYNACPRAAVDALVAFLRDFARKNG